MHFDILALTSLIAGVQLSFYGGFFLPINAMIMQQEKNQAFRNLKRWITAYAITSIVLGYLFFMTGASGLMWINVLNNIFLIVFGTLLLVNFVWTKPLLHYILHQKSTVTFVAIMIAINIFNAVSLAASLVHPTLLQITISIFSFILASVITIAILNLIFWFIGKLTKAGKLPRYLAILFAVLCIVIGLLNTLSIYG